LAVLWVSLPNSFAAVSKDVVDSAYDRELVDQYREKFGVIDRLIIAGHYDDPLRVLPLYKGSDSQTLRLETYIRLYIIAILKDDKDTLCRMSEELAFGDVVDKPVEVPSSVGKRLARVLSHAASLREASLNFENWREQYSKIPCDLTIAPCLKMDFGWAETDPVEIIRAGNPLEVIEEHAREAARVQERDRQVAELSGSTDCEDRQWRRPQGS